MFKPNLQIISWHFVPLVILKFKVIIYSKKDVINVDLI